MKILILRLQDGLYEEFKIFARALDLHLNVAIREAMNDWICTQACDEEVVQKIRNRFGYDKELMEKLLGEV